MRDLVRWGASEFNRAGLAFGHGTDNALDEAFHLVLWRLALPFDLPAVYLEAAVTADEREAVIALLRERIQTRKPAAYLTGEAWFAGLPFFVDERVLVPRSPIAELIERGFAPWFDDQPQRILDLCAGSGCIGIACATRFERAAVVLAELDSGALALCRRNVERHHLQDRVTPVQGDLFAPVAGQTFDLIVANPPYVPTAEWQELPAEYQREPRLALDGGADGMTLVERILQQAPAYLDEGGVLVCEIGGSRQEFDRRYPDIPVEWPAFERGGDGVFVIDRDELLAWRDARDLLRRSA